jgi:hypothetical protein
MILPDRVLQSAITVSLALGEAYGMIKRLCADLARHATAPAPPTAGNASAPRTITQRPIGH